MTRLEMAVESCLAWLCWTVGPAVVGAVIVWVAGGDPLWGVIWGAIGGPLAIGLMWLPEGIRAWKYRRMT